MPIPPIQVLRLRRAVLLALLVVVVQVPARTADLNPSWRILALIYQTTDFSYRDAQGVDHRVVGSLTAADLTGADAILRRFVSTDVPQLSNGHQFPSLTVRVRPALTTLTRIGQRSWWPNGATDLGTDRDLTFDTIIVIWQTIGIDQFSGRREELSAEFGGLASYYANAHTYVSASVFGANLFGFGRNLLKHEWGHNILLYYDATGGSPKPAVNNHINSTTMRYVNCLTGAPYILVDETDAAPIPNSIYNNTTGFTHDYFSGLTATADNPTRCLGITPAAWARGGPVTKTGGTPAPMPPAAPLGVSGVATGTTVALNWQPSAGATSYRVRAGTTPQTANAFDGDVGNATSVTAQNVPAATYFIRVHAVGPFGESGPSSEITVPVGISGPCAAPAAPTLSGSVAGSTVTLSWGSLPGITGYVLEAGSTSGTSDIARLDLGSGPSSFTASAVPVGTYFLRLRAMSACGAGAPSAELRLDVR